MTLLVLLIFKFMILCATFEVVHFARYPLSMLDEDLLDFFVFSGIVEIIDVASRGQFVNMVQHDSAQNIFVLPKPYQAACVRPVNPLS